MEVIKRTSISFLPRSRHLVNRRDHIQPVELKLITDLTSQKSQNQILTGLEKSSNLPYHVPMNQATNKFMFNCEAKFVSGKVDLNSVFAVESGLSSSGNYACLFTPLDESLQFE